jgi:anti-anti-sigma factor
MAEINRGTFHSIHRAMQVRRPVNSSFGTEGKPMDTAIRTKKQGNAIVVSVKGKMDAVSSPEFERQLSELIGQGEKDFVVDMGELEYLSSAGLRVILAIVKLLKEKEGHLFICDLKDMVKEVFKISGFGAIIPIYDSVDSALAHI